VTADGRWVLMNETMFVLFFMFALAAHFEEPPDGEGQ
jgi:hypothetical protein